MAEPTRLENALREWRLRRGWSQDELARRAGLSRAGVSGAETGRLVPSTAAALALAAALGCRVEELFSLPGRASPGAAPGWAWDPAAAGGRVRYWEAEVGGALWRYPAEPTLAGTLPHDGLSDTGPEPDAFDPRRTLVLAACDPAAGLLADVLLRTEGVRLVVLTRSSRAALALVAAGKAHAAGVHLAGASGPDGNADAARAAVGPGCRLIRAATWEEAVALAPGRRAGTPGEAVRAGLRWVGREEGSGARQCLDELLDGRRPPRHLARDHRGVAEAVRAGWADAGVCLRLAAEEAGLTALAVRREAYDLCVPAPLRDDPRVAALLRALRSPAYRRRLAVLPGYDAGETGEDRVVGG